MSEEEKKAIEKLKEYALCKVNDNGYVEVSANGYKHTILNLIENQQKELNNLKEIEKSHQEENGKLRVELEQEKEKNKNAGKLVKNKIDGTIGIVLREWETGQIQVLENIQPKIINTHDNWKTLELIEESE